MPLPAGNSEKETASALTERACLAGTRSRLINSLSYKGGTLRRGCTASLVSTFRTMACAALAGRRRRQLVRLSSDKIGSPAPVREPPLPIGQALLLAPHLGALLGAGRVAVPQPAAPRCLY